MTHFSGIMATTTDIIAIAREFPAMNITVNAGDLVRAIDYCVDRARRSAEREAAEADNDRLMSRDETRAMLGVSFQTLHRWEVAGYLVPVHIGVAVKYWRSDVVAVTRRKSEQRRTNTH